MLEQYGVSAACSASSVGRLDMLVTTAPSGSTTTMSEVSVLGASPKTAAGFGNTL